MYFCEKLASTVNLGLFGGLKINTIQENTRTLRVVLALSAVYMLVALESKSSSAVEMPAGNEYTNSIGMKFVRIEPGSFRMGQLKTPLPWEILPVLYLKCRPWTALWKPGFALPR